jgi:hypothetical protein
MTRSIRAACGAARDQEVGGRDQGAVDRNRPVVPTRRKQIKLTAGTGEKDADGVEWWTLPDDVIAIGTAEECRLLTKDAVGEITLELMVAGMQKVGVFTAVAPVARRPDVVCYLR